MAKSSKSKSSKIKVGRSLSGKKLIMLLVLVLAFAAGGVYYITNSKAATPIRGGSWFAFYFADGSTTYHQVGNLVYDSGVNGNVWSSGTPGFMWYGPYRSLTPTSATNPNDYYYACFQYRVTSNNTNVRFDVTANAGASVLAVRNLTSAGYMSEYNVNENPGAPNCVKFKVTSATSSKIEFRVILNSGSIRVSQVTLAHLY